MSPRPPAPRRPVLLLAGIFVISPVAAALFLFVRANGVTVAALALAAFVAMLVLLLLAVTWASPRGRRRLAAAALALAAVDLAYVAARLARPAPGPDALRYCEDGDCARRGPWIARIPDEGESALAGLQLSSALGFIGGVEQAALDRLLRREYAALAASPRYAGLPVAPLIFAAARHARTLQWVPPGKERAPCIVFLHGFGGQLTVYLQSLIESGLGDDFVIVAPFLDPGAQWWGAEGEAVVLDVVTRRLPAAADRDRVVLMGLSNGAIGAARLLQRPALRPLFRGGVLLSGSAGPVTGDLGGLELLILAGRDDPRFPLRGVEADAEALRAQGAGVALEVLPGDHFIVLSHAPELAARLRAWVAPRMPGSG